jgi:hypothetical protein
MPGQNNDHRAAEQHSATGQKDDLKNSVTGKEQPETSYMHNTAAKGVNNSNGQSQEHFFTY